MKNTNKRFKLYQELRLLNFDILDAESAEAEVVESLREAAIGKQDGTLEEDECRAVWLEYCAAVSNTNQAVDKGAAKLTELYLHETENFPNYFYAFGRRLPITLSQEYFAVDFFRCRGTLVSNEFREKSLERMQDRLVDLRLYSDADVDRSELTDSLEALIPVYYSEASGITMCFLPEVQVSVADKDEQSRIAEFVNDNALLATIDFTPKSVCFRVQDSITALKLANEITEKFQVQTATPKVIQFFTPH